MWNNRRQFILGSLLFLGTVTFFMIVGDLRVVGVTSVHSKDQSHPVSIHDHGCYTISNTFANTAHSNEVLEERSCSKSVPNVLIIGSKKCGTTTLKNFLGFHPQIAAAETEAHYYDTNIFMGLDWFIDQLPYALPNQLVVEKTPRYLVYPGVQEKMKKDLSPDIKLIIVLREPVTRAISDFTHITFKRYTSEKHLRDKRTDGKPSMSPEQAALRKHFKKIEAKNNQRYPNYDKMGLTFEDSVLTDKGDIDVNSAIIDTSIYVKYLKKWLKYYSRDQILVLDGEQLILEPYQIMQKVEKFLGIEPYFLPENFHFNVQKRFYCLSQPIYACMKPSKGRVHPSVSDEIVDKLKQFYTPYNIELEELLNQTFSWT
ncbi:heparan sulfate glucosamine 3-O-sulfotransferase 1 [Strongylocentrotus purpuratus]|uniref:Sulfotransferase domain-containing protein n=1 Tax=Strongylocentrotus purpuratus TaxID=7668 RepID=A0A7M7HPF9_STRPU|nr:heparan sulfate glucosamine 3-O-sulfotransferase 1 [Strongylocentrotus purpuratus]XP_011678906.2 heparan sulfate glucosamine 3-O-sulfotransferase 1 [Strongylocentrotus purpuratus]XP_011678907.2 heparan sulfate glucosamine 3-O-sulfotransferase 1 [Strongylocentrotus purpuratus]XP_011678909.2 heparan sulfate glucosamine 3-O-sulfotransferase 1 [Strongylocentrotus purpuratus]XP_011678911.2 heparan sulfate glucosamine 3-O-sulfotransferase 1 [Strongylocentrotus purpuratus]XP_011678912.2 heparan su